MSQLNFTIGIVLLKVLVIYVIIIMHGLDTTNRSQMMMSLGEGGGGRGRGSEALIRANFMLGAFHQIFIRM